MHLYKLTARIILRTQVEFKSNAFPPYLGEDEEINPGRWGKRLADYLVAELPKHGMEIKGTSVADWGIIIPIKNGTFYMYIGCGNQDSENDDQYLCFIEPSVPEIKKGLFKKISTVAEVEIVADALNKALTNHPNVHDIVWS